MDDLISRQAAIAEFDGVKVDEENCTEYDIGYNDGIDFAVSRLSVLPSAEPVRMKGKWERHYSRPNVYADMYWHCSVCGYKDSENFANIYHHFCPNCGSEMEEEKHKSVFYFPSDGADMRGEEDEAD